MNYRYFILLFSILFYLSGCQEEKKITSQPKKTKVEKKTNVILIMADDQGWGDLGSSGNVSISTPNIDAIAKNGVSFENFYVQPVCSPTRAELLTGRHFPRTGVYSTSSGGERMDYEETTLAEIFKKGGYRTAVYGKWHNGTQPPYHPNSQGFEDFYGFTSGHWGNYFSPMLERNGKIVKGKGFLVDDLTEQGLNFIDKNKEEPFFLYLPLNTPHSPMQVPDAYWNRFKDKDLGRFADEIEPRNAESIDVNKAALAMVENIDYNVGRIMAKLRKLYLEDDTIVIYMTDNGPNSFRWNGGMRGIKGSTDEGGVRSPFYIQWKDSLPEGKTISEIASALDILPTISKMVNLPPVTSKTIDGKDLTPLLFGEDSTWDDRLIYNHWNSKTSLRTQNYRLDTENRLYNIKKDRSQKIDISNRYPQLRDSLVKMKSDWLSDVKPLTTETDVRPFTLGHPSYLYTLMPARDGIPHGNIQRSSIHPNDSYFKNWTSVKDSITWDVAVLEDGHFVVDLYYTATEKNLGSIVELSLGNSKIAKKITVANDVPLKGMEKDRVPRKESYVKDFKPMKLGTMVLKEGKGTLTLKTLGVAGKEVADIRLLMFRKVE